MEDYGFYDLFQETTWGRDPTKEFVMLLHDHQRIPDGVSAHVIVKPSFRMGEVSAKLMIRRNRGYRAEIIHETVSHTVVLNMSRHISPRKISIPTPTPA